MSCYYIMNLNDEDDELIFDNRTLKNKIFSVMDLDEERNKSEIEFLTVKKNNEKDKFITISKDNYQADLVTMPIDNGYRYFLCIVNIWNRKLDAEACKTKTAIETRDALIRILDRNNITKPSFLLTDSGSEFNNEIFTEYCRTKGINIAFASTQRKNQMAIVEYYNGLIEKFLYTKMGVETIKQHARNRVWVRYLPIVITEINKWNALHYPKYQMSDIVKMEIPIKQLSDLIPLGTWVYPKLFKPMDLVEGTQLFGKFRHGDPRFRYTTPLRIRTYLFHAGRPIRYVLDGINDTSFTKSELIVARNQNQYNQHNANDNANNNDNDNDNDNINDNNFVNFDEPDDDDHFEARQRLRQFPRATIQNLAESIVQTEGPRRNRNRPTTRQMRQFPQSTLRNLSNAASSG